jgi:hypothetical protein
MALTSERHKNSAGGCCPDCGREFVFSPETATYQTLNAGGENVLLLTLRCLGCPWQGAWRVDDKGDPFPTDTTVAQPNNGEGSVDIVDEDFELTKRAIRSVMQKRKLETLAKKVADLEEKLVKQGPKGFEGLRRKNQDLSRFFDEANLTDKQLEVASLLWEYDLSLGEVAKRLQKHHSTIQYFKVRAEKKMEIANTNRKRARRRAGWEC